MSREQTPNTATALGDIMREISHEYRLEAQQRPRNKATLFAALKAEGVALVVATFDGSGDSGQVEGIEAKTGDTPVQLSGALIAYAHISGHPGEVAQQPTTLEQAIENLVYDVLRQAQPGWENNDGAYGEVVFDVAAGTIRLDFNGRYTTSEFSQHDF
jgi:hypothetical protein